jgi:drug/metabolite transporter (DMT)-like permease
MPNNQTIGVLRKPTRFDLSLLVLLAIIWASAFLAIKVVVPETGPLWLATLRVVIAFLVLIPFAVIKGIIWPANSRQWVIILLIMSLNVVLPFFLISWAEQHIDAGVTALLMGAGPFMALIGSHFTTLDDKFTIPKVIGVLLGFAGVSVLVGWASFQGLGTNLLAQGAALLGAVSYVASGLLIRKLSGFPADRLTALVLGLSSISLCVITLLVVGLPAQNFSMRSWVWLVYLGVFPTALGYILRYHLVQTIGLSAFSMSVNLIPVFGVVLSAVLLGEVLSANLFISLALVVSGLFVIRLGIK